MDQHQADQLVMIHLSKLQPEYVQIIRERLLTADNTTAAMAFSTLKDPTIVLILSIFLGAYGIDRFFLGDIGLGVIKLLTLGGCGIWWFIDLFLVMGNTRQKNTEKILQFLNFN